MSTTVNKRGRPRSQRDWNKDFKLNALVGFTKHPAVHTFLFVNMENEQLSEIVAKALEDYLKIHAPEYFNAEYQAEVVREARARETEKLMQTLRPESDQVEIVRPSIPVQQSKEESTLDSPKKKEEGEKEEVPIETAQKVPTSSEEVVPEQKVQAPKGGLFAAVSSGEKNPENENHQGSEQVSQRENELANRFIG